MLKVVTVRRFFAIMSQEQKATSFAIGAGLTPQHALSGIRGLLIYLVRWRKKVTIFGLVSHHVVQDRLCLAIYRRHDILIERVLNL